MKKLDCILLVEDDDTINFYNQFLIQNLGLAKEVVITKNGQEALTHLNKIGAEGGKFPELILLDINMPVMNGFEFIEAYDQLSEDWKAKMLIVMLTTSHHENDLLRAKQHGSIAEYFFKPLLEQRLGDLIAQYFPA